MASPARGLTPREEAGVLRDFYLVLWKQLDLKSGESKWFDIAAVSAPDLEARADELLKQLDELQAADDLLRGARNDRQHLLETINNQIPADEFERFKTYLRDRALDFAQQAANVV